MASATPLPAAPAPAPPDGDLPVSVREWRRATKGEHRRSNFWQLLTLWLPLLLFLGGALVMFRRLTARLADVYAVLLQQRLPRSAGPEVDTLLAAFDLAEVVARAQWWSVALISGALLAMAAALMGFLALLGRLALIATPRTRADLQLFQQMAKAQLQTILPALLTAAVVYFIWLGWSAAASLSDQAAVLDAHRLIDSFVALLAGLIALMVGNTVALIAAPFRRREAPREHLLRSLGRSLAGLLMTSLILLAIYFTFLFLFPRQVVPAVDRLVLAHLDGRVLEIARSNDLAATEEIRRMVRDLPLRLQVEKATMIRDILDEVPLRRFFYTLALLWIAATASLQACVACLARGVSRWVWSAAAVVGAILLLAILTGRFAVFEGEAGFVRITAYVVLACAATWADVFLNPAISPRRVAAGDPVELERARVRLQEGCAGREEAVERARRVYARVGCALDGVSAK